MKIFKQICQCLALGSILLPTLVLGVTDDAPNEISYVKLAPSIVANLNGGPKYIRCDVQLMTLQADRVPDIELHAAALRHEIFMLIPDQDGQALATVQGKEAFRKRLLKALQNTLKEKTGDPLIKDLYFTNFYVQ